MPRRHLATPPDVHACTRTPCAQVISFYQVFAAVPAGYAVNVPDEYEKLTAWLKFLNLDLLNVYPSG